jgi:type VI secretion system protein ImpK
MQRPADPHKDRHATRRPMEGAFRAFVGEVLRIKRGVVAAPGTSACDVVQQRVLDHFRAVNEQIERRLGAHDARAYEDVKYLMIAAADEAFLQFEWAGRAAWAARPLEAQEHRSHDAGERVFRTLDEVLERRATLPTEVLLVYLHVLSIGFRGRFAPIEPGKPEEYRRRLVEHLTRLGERLTREEGALCPEALEHTIKQHSRLKIEPLSRGVLPLVLAVAVWIVLGAVLFQLRTSALDELLDRIEAIR